MKIISILLLLFLNSAEIFSQKTSPNTPKICYEIFVRSFADSNNDGIGDINGITSKLDYLQDLGVDAIWITPVCKSSSYHKYDVEDYYQIDPQYGTIADFKHLIAEAHRRNILIIKDLVINHTSNKHFWFQEASKGKDNQYRNFYDWLTPKEIEARGLALREVGGGSWELNPWHFAKKGDTEKYYGLFSGTMPDLNYDEPRVREEVYKIGKYWLNEIGVDGFRLDAAKHIYPEWEAEKCHAFWEEFRQEMQSVKPNVYLVGEIWAKPEIVAPFFKGLPSNFNMDLALNIQQVVKAEKDDSLVKKLINNYKIFSKANPNFIDATIIDNHDQDRIMSVVGNDENRAKVAANLLFTLSGQPYVYYGEEIGMRGKKPDEYIREPFLWDKRGASPDRTQWLKPRYSTDSVVTPLKFQQNDENSMYNHYKKLIHLRKSYEALSHVSPVNIAESNTKNNAIIAFIRPFAGGDLLVIHNVSAKKQAIKIQDKGFKNLSYSSNKNSFLNADNLEIKPYSFVILTEK